MTLGLASLWVNGVQAQGTLPAMPAADAPIQENCGNAVNHLNGFHLATIHAGFTPRAQLVINLSIIITLHGFRWIRLFFQ